MKRNSTIVIVLCLLLSHLGFAQNSWVQKASLDSPINNGSHGCAIGNKAYIVLGSDPGSHFEDAPKFSLYAYDPATNTWSKKANTPEQTLNGGLAFAVGTRGYFALSGGVWEYESTSDTWTKKLLPPPGSSQFKIGFGIGAKAYVVGIDRDFWEYDPTTGSFTRKADYPSPASFNLASGFNIGNRGFITATQDPLDPVNRDGLWEYQPSTNSWIERPRFGGTINLGSTGFSVAGKGYVTTAYQFSPSVDFSETHLWQYDTLQNSWTEKAPLPDPRTAAVGFGIGNKGYIAFGTRSYRTGRPAANDLWEYTPDNTTTPPVLVGTGAGLSATYYNGINLNGAPLLNRIDSTIDFSLTYASHQLSPAPGIVPEDQYSVRWKGQVQPQFSETYTFYTQSDDGIRLWVNGVQLVDNWQNQGVTEKSGSIALVAGQRYDIVVEYFENTGEAVTRLLWSSASTPKSVIPRTQLYPAPEPLSAGTGLLGRYYKERELTGPLLLTRIDPVINFNLAYGNQPQVLSPAPGIVPEDNYSVRWSGQVQPLHDETYTFYTQADDGVRLWVNGKLLIDKWLLRGTTEDSGNITLGAGFKYDIVLEYFEGTGDAVTKLFWASASTPKALIPTAQLYQPTTGTGLQAVYYNGINLSGSPLLTRIDSTINLELTYTKQPVVLSPAPGIVPEDHFSVRWSGQVLAQHSEAYTFYALTDDGVRLWVNGTLLIDNWVNQGATEKSGSIVLTAGQKYDIVMEYFENTGEAVSKLYWSSSSTPKQIIPATQLFPPAAQNGNYNSGDRIGVMEAPVTTKAAAVAMAFAPSVHPNPVANGQSIQLTVYSNRQTPAIVYITGSNGNIVKTRPVQLQTGSNTITLPSNGMASGFYIVTVRVNGKLFNNKLLLQ